MLTVEFPPYIHPVKCSVSSWKNPTSRCEAKEASLETSWERLLDQCTFFPVPTCITHLYDPEIAPITLTGSVWGSEEGCCKVPPGGAERGKPHAVPVQPAADRRAQAHPTFLIGFRHLPRDCL